MIMNLETDFETRPQSHSLTEGSRRHHHLTISSQPQPLPSSSSSSQSPSSSIQSHSIHHQSYYQHYSHSRVPGSPSQAKGVNKNSISSSQSLYLKRNDDGSRQCSDVNSQQRNMSEDGNVNVQMSLSLKKLLTRSQGGNGASGDNSGLAGGNVGDDIITPKEEAIQIAAASAAEMEMNSNVVGVVGVVGDQMRRLSVDSAVCLNEDVSDSMKGLESPKSFRKKLSFDAVDVGLDLDLELIGDGESRSRLCGDLNVDEIVLPPVAAPNVNVTEIESEDTSLSIVTNNISNVVGPMQQQQHQQQPVLQSPQSPQTTLGQFQQQYPLNMNIINFGSLPPPEMYVSHKPAKTLNRLATLRHWDAGRMARFWLWQDRQLQMMREEEAKKVTRRAFLSKLRTHPWVTPPNTTTPVTSELQDQQQTVGTGNSGDVVAILKSPSTSMIPPATNPTTPTSTSPTRSRRNPQLNMLPYQDPTMIKPTPDQQRDQKSREIETNVREMQERTQKRRAAIETLRAKSRRGGNVVIGDEGGVGIEDVWGGAVPPFEKHRMTLVGEHRGCLVKRLGVEAVKGVLVVALERRQGVAQTVLDCNRKRIFEDLDQILERTESRIKSLLPDVVAEPTNTRCKDTPSLDIPTTSTHTESSTTTSTTSTTTISIKSRRRGAAGRSCKPVPATPSSMVTDLQNFWKRVNAQKMSLEKSAAALEACKRLEAATVGAR
ncbi:hypothetical protein HDU76_013952 [Blyttiomyces sp. JEL0837]|nr:hypothetical protein HDU76_013952 [Blyttiomyces sp. JEL0837]